MDQYGSFDTEEALSTIDREIKRNGTKLHRQIFKTLNPTNAPTVKLIWFKKVNTLGRGESFGELALQFG